MPALPHPRLSTLWQSVCDHGYAGLAHQHGCPQLRAGGTILFERLPVEHRQHDRQRRRLLEGVHACELRRHDNSLRREARSDWHWAAMYLAHVSSLRAAAPTMEVTDILWHVDTTEACGAAAHPVHHPCQAVQDCHTRAWCCSMWLRQTEQQPKRVRSAASMLLVSVTIVAVETAK